MNPKKRRGDSRQSLRILVVEDESMFAFVLEDMLVELGHKVIGPVGRLNKALSIAQRELLDFAILDVNLHGQETYPVAEVLAVRGIPFAFATGYDRKGLRAPYCDGPVLQKPFIDTDLRNVIDEFCP